MITHSDQHAASTIQGGKARGDDPSPPPGKGVFQHNRPLAVLQDLLCERALSTEADFG
jgi:hypothetical protein